MYYALFYDLKWLFKIYPSVYLVKVWTFDLIRKSVIEYRTS